RLRLLLERPHITTHVYPQLAEPAGRTHGRDRRQPSVVAVELQEGGHVDIAHAVAVGHHHRAVAEMPSRPPDASAGEAVEACVDARHPPTEFVVLLEVTDGLGPAQLDV